jgi:hypothetical protein
MMAPMMEWVVDTASSQYVAIVTHAHAEMRAHNMPSAKTWASKRAQAKHRQWHSDSGFSWGGGGEAGLAGKEAPHEAGRGWAWLAVLQSRHCLLSVYAVHIRHNDPVLPSPSLA